LLRDIVRLFSVNEVMKLIICPFHG
jgi:hypothetical protein